MLIADTLGAKITQDGVNNIEASVITKHRSAVVAVLSAKSRFSAKTVSVKPSFWCISKSLFDNRLVRVTT